MSVSRQQMCGLFLVAVCCLIFGGAITVCGFLFDYLEPYNAEDVNGQSYAKSNTYEYYYTQYWLGIPLFVLGILLLIFLCCKVKAVLVLCILLSSFTVVLSIAAVVLEGPKWREWISRRRYVLHNDEKEISGNHACIVPEFPLYLGSKQDPLTCRQIYYATLMQSVIVACSIMGILISHFTIFFSLRLLGWMSRGSYDMHQMSNNSKTFNNYGSKDVVITSEM